MRSHLFALLILASLVPALTGCLGGAQVQWRDSEADLAWPKPPEKPRLRYLRTLSTEDRGQKETGKFLGWLTGEEAAEPLLSPYGVAADGQGKIWVTDGASRSVRLFDLTRGRVTSLHTAGEAEFVFPVGIAIDPLRKTLYIADSGQGKVFRFDLAGRFRGEIHSPGGLVRPGGLALDAAGNLFVADALGGKIEVFSPDGNHVRSIGSLLSPDGRFRRPVGVAVDRSGRIFVVDALNFRVEVIGPTGESLGTIGSLGDSPGSFARPRGVAVDSEGHVYVTDAAFDNVQIFDTEGSLLLVLGRAGKKKGEFCLPAGLASDAEDRLYVVDSCNQRIQVFQYLK